MNAEPTALVRFGAWGQVGTVPLAVGSWWLGILLGFLAAGLGYLVVTSVGILGIGRRESAIGGAIWFPFLVPGFVPLYYFVTR
jgi:hypothetical protein